MTLIRGSCCEMPANCEGEDVRKPPGGRAERTRGGIFSPPSSPRGAGGMFIYIRSPWDSAPGGDRSGSLNGISQAAEVRGLRRANPGNRGAIGPTRLRPNRGPRPCARGAA